MKPVISANLFWGWESMGGKLYFGDREMVFESHALNFQRGRRVIPYAEIVNVQKRNSLGLVPNGIAVTTQYQGELKFVISGDRDEIIHFIRLRADAAGRTCPACRVPTPPGVKFCPECGERLET